jgi:tetratricopeptide (TPR) repeat protein
MRFIFSIFMLISALTYGQSERAILYAQATEFGYRNQFKEAEKILSKVIDLFPNDSMAYFDRAIMREHLGDTLGAIADLTREIEIDEKSADNYFVRGILYQKTKKYSLALDDFRKVNHLDFGNADAHYFAAQMYSILQENTFFVKRQLKQCLKVNPAHHDALIQLKNTRRILFRMN